MTLSEQIKETYKVFNISALIENLKSEEWTNTLRQEMSMLTFDERTSIICRILLDSTINETEKLKPFFLSYKEELESVKINVELTNTENRGNISKWDLCKLFFKELFKS